MKSQLIIGSMLLGTVLFAQKKDKNNGSKDNSYNDTNSKSKKEAIPVSCECPCTCKEECEPAPEKCIDCVCYNPPFYVQNCDCGIFAFVDILVWYARETNLPYAMEFTSTLLPAATTVGTDVLVGVPVAIFYNDADWDPGFRLGAGWNSTCDSWDVSLYWTYYHNKSKNTSTSGVTSLAITDGVVFLPQAGQTLLINPWVNSSFSTYFGGALSFDEITAQWRLNFNQIDLELGKKYWVSRCFNFRPFASLRAAWTRTTFQTNSEKNNVNLFLNFQDEFKNRNWGIGFSVGVQPVWYIWGNFAIFAGVDAALLWGEFKGTKNEIYNYERLVGDDIINWGLENTSTSRLFKMMPILDVSIGLRWEDRWWNNRLRSSFDFGWENHIWFDHGIKNATLDPILITATTPDVNSFRTFNSNWGNLEYGGFVFRARFDW